VRRSADGGQRRSRWTSSILSTARGPGRPASSTRSTGSGSAGLSRRPACAGRAAGCMAGVRARRVSRHRTCGRRSRHVPVGAHPRTVRRATASAVEWNAKHPLLSIDEQGVFCILYFRRMPIRRLARIPLIISRRTAVPGGRQVRSCRENTSPWDALPDHVRQRARSSSSVTAEELSLSSSLAMNARIRRTLSGSGRGVGGTGMIAGPHSCSAAAVMAVRTHHFR
jgi:hypothetical protein